MFYIIVPIAAFFVGVICGGLVMGFIASVNIQEDRLDDYDIGYAQGRKDERDEYASKS